MTSKFLFSKIGDILKTIFIRIILIFINLLIFNLSYANFKNYFIDKGFYYSDSLIPSVLKNKISIARFDSLKNENQQIPDWKLKLQPGDYISIPQFTSGDFNGDGFKDLIINTHRNEDRRIELLYIYYSSANGLKEEPDEIFILNDPLILENMVLTYFDCVGDINGDGYDDIVINYYHNNMGHTEQNPKIYYGSEKGLNKFSNHYCPTKI